MNNEMLFLNKVYHFFHSKDLSQSELIEKIYKDGGVECSELNVCDIVNILNDKELDSYSEVIFAISELTAFYAAGGGLSEKKSLDAANYIKIQNQYIKQYAKDNILTFICMMFCLFILRKCIIMDVAQSDMNQSLSPMLGVMYILSKWLPLDMTVAFFQKCFNDEFLNMADESD